MKKIFLSFCLLVIAATVFGQHPIGNDSFALQTLGSSATLVKSKGAIGSDSGFVNAKYADTTAANRGNKLKNYPGAQIRVGDSIWMRNNTATRWLNITGSGGSSFDSSILRGVYMDTLYLINDTTMRACKAATCWDIHIGSSLITFEGDTTVINKIKIKNLLSIPLTDTTNAVKYCGALIYDTINEHFYVDDCLDGVHNYWACNDCSGTGGITAVYAGYGLTNVNDSTLRVDTSLISTKANVDSKTISLHAGTNVSIPEAATQNLGTPPSWTINASDSASYHTITQITDSSFKLCRLNGTCDTVAFAAGAKVDSIWRTPGKDSIQFSINGRYHAIKDSTASGAALTATQIGFGSASNLLTGVDSLTYSSTNRLITTTNSQAGATFTAYSSATIQGLNALILQNTSPATATELSLSSPYLLFGAQGRKTNATAGSWQSWWGIGSVATSGASSLNPALQFYALSGNGQSPSGLVYKAALEETGLFTASGNLRAGGTGGAGTVFASIFDASTTSGTGVTLNASNSSNSSILAKFAGNEVMKFFQATKNVSFQNGGTIPADAADGGQFNIYQLSGMTGISTVSGTGGTANLTGGATNFINQVQPGDQIAIAIPNAETLTVLSVTDATHLVFTANMANSHTNAGYTIIPATTRKFTLYNNGNSLQNGKSMYANTITAGGTTGNRTIDKPTGTVNIAAGGTTVTVTNSLCTASSIVFAVIRTNDATAQIKSVVPAAGSFVINIVASTGEVSIGWIVHN